MLKQWLRKAPFYSRYTFYHHFWAVCGDGAFAGVFSLLDVVLKKALHATNWQITVINSLLTFGLLFSIFWSNLMQGRSKRPYLLTAAVSSRLILLAFVIIYTPGPVILLAFIATVGSSITIPALSSIYQANYDSAYRARFFGYATSVAGLVMAVVTYLAGLALDYNEQLYRLIFPLAGLVGFAGFWQYMRIRIRSHPQRARNQPVPLTFQAVVLAPLADTLHILKTDRAYRHFQINFMLYGFGFIMTATLIPIFLVDYIGANYSQIAGARSVLFPLILMTLSPLYGRFIDKSNPFLVGSIFFGLLAFYPLILSVSTSMSMVYGAFVIFGIAMCGVNIIWSLGGIYFAGAQDSARYMGVHVALTGIRGLIAPFLAYAVMSATSIRTAFLLAAAFLLTGSLRMWQMYRQTMRKAAPIADC